MKFVLHRGTDLALLAMHRLSHEGRAVSGSELADRIGTSIGFLPQIMAPLIKAGWVASDRGPGGGYRLTDEASKAHLLDVIRATEGSDEDNRCVMREGPCPGDPSCPIHPVWMKARQVLMQGFEGMPALLAGKGTTK